MKTFRGIFECWIILSSNGSFLFIFIDFHFVLRNSRDSLQSIKRKQPLISTPYIYRIFLHSYININYNISYLKQTFLTNMVKIKLSFTYPELVTLLLGDSTSCLVACDSSITLTFEKIFRGRALKNISLFRPIFILEFLPILCRKSDIFFLFLHFVDLSI